MAKIQKNTLRIIEKCCINEIGHKNTFENRVLTEVPKYVLRKMSTSINENETINSNMSTFKNDN